MNSLNSGTVKSNSECLTGYIIPLFISWALVGEIVLTFLSNCFAILEIVHGSSLQLTIANMNFLSPSEHLSYLTLKKPVSSELKNKSKTLSMSCVSIVLQSVSLNAILQSCWIKKVFSFHITP